MKTSSFYLVAVIAVVATVSARPLSARDELTYNECADDNLEGGDSVTCESGDSVEEGSDGGEDSYVEGTELLDGGEESYDEGTETLDDGYAIDEITGDEDLGIEGEDVGLGGGIGGGGSSGSSLVDLHGLKVNVNHVGEDILNRLIIADILNRLNLRILGQ